LWRRCVLKPAFTRSRRGVCEERAAVDGLDGAVVAVINGGERRNLLGRHLDWMDHQKPAYSFAAGRRGQRAYIAEGGLVSGKEVGGVDLYIVYLFGAFGGRQAIPHRLERRIGRTFVDQHAYNCLLAVGSLVHQVEFDRGWLAVHGMLARRMEMELLEVVLLAVHCSAATATRSVAAW
jgi:hypothetical protein